MRDSNGTILSRVIIKMDNDGLLCEDHDYNHGCIKRERQDADPLESRSDSTIFVGTSLCHHVHGRMSAAPQLGACCRKIPLTGISFNSKLWKSLL